MITSLSSYQFLSTLFLFLFWGALITTKQHCNFFTHTVNTHHVHYCIICYYLLIVCHSFCSVQGTPVKHRWFQHFLCQDLNTIKEQVILRESTLDDPPQVSIVPWQSKCPKRVTILLVVYLQNGLSLIIWYSLNILKND